LVRAQSVPAWSTQTPAAEQQAPKAHGFEGVQVYPTGAKVKPVGQTLVPVITAHSPVPLLLQQTALQGEGWQVAEPGRNVLDPVQLAENVRVQVRELEQHEPTAQEFVGEHVEAKPAKTVFVEQQAPMEQSPAVQVLPNPWNTPGVPERAHVVVLVGAAMLHVPSSWLQQAPTQGLVGVQVDPLPR